MQFEYKSAPTEGSPFHISFVDAIGPVNISFYVDDKLINTTTCTDPPCHEMIWVCFI